MHVSAIDAPSDQYGSVTDVSRPLIYKLNQASMQQSTYDALHALLVWALATLEGGLHDSLLAHQGHSAVVAPVETPAPENRPPESTQDARTAPAEGGSPSAEVKSLVEARSLAVSDARPLTAELLEESAEDSALEAEAAAVADTPAAPATEVAALPEEPAVGPAKRLSKPK